MGFIAKNLKGKDLNGMEYHQTKSKSQKIQYRQRISEQSFHRVKIKKPPQVGGFFYMIRGVLTKFVIRFH